MHGHTNIKFLRALFVIDVYAVRKGVGSDLYILYSRIEAFNIVKM